VVEHRGEVDALRTRVEEALRGIGETEGRIEVVETRRKVVDDVHRKTNVIVHLLEDVRVNLEMVSEQKAVLDHVVENVATLDETLRAAQSTQRSLRVERELAERIERGIKSLRTKIGSTAPTDDDDPTDN
jgi:t-SNARE complex subunit (syntaxin)